MVEQLEIFGKEYPVRIGYYTMKKVKEETGKSFSDALADAEEEGEIEIHETILYYALRMGAYAETKDMDTLDIEKEEMPMVVDACFADYIELFDSEAFFPKKLREKMNEEGPQLPESSKKKGQKRKRKKT